MKGICAVCGKSLDEHPVGDDGYKHYCRKPGAPAGGAKGKGKGKKGKNDKGGAVADSDLATGGERGQVLLEDSARSAHEGGSVFSLSHLCRSSSCLVKDESLRDWLIQKAGNQADSAGGAGPGAAGAGGQKCRRTAR